jgi:Fe-S cluster biogenesis protein NfuA/nitrite reductase/ring-hydroxylating ferredoxin subunit
VSATVPSGELGRRVQELLARLESLDDDARATAEELAGALLELHGAGLRRILDTLDDAGRRGLAEDEAVASLLLIHGLHPVGLEERVLVALERVRPYLQSHGGDVELVALADDVARLRLRGSCDGCASSAATLELAIEQALEETAPDLLGVEVEGAAPVFSGRALPLAPTTWVELGAEAPASGATASVAVAGVPLLLANVGGTLLAYRDACAACGASLRDGELDGGALACPSCGRSFVLPLAGRSLDEEGEPLQLAPVPLLAADGRVRVAVA